MSTTAEEKVILTAEQAIEMLPDGETVHTFRNPGANLMVGCDWDRQHLIDAIRGAVGLELAGPIASKSHHGLVVWTDETSPLFVETRKDGAR